MSGDDGKEVTPVPMPNTEVKLFSADGSWGFPPVRVGRCQAVAMILISLCCEASAVLSASYKTSKKMLTL